MRILTLIGTRPEAIKLAPVILRLQQSSTLQPIVCSTGQHKEMLATALAEFGIQPDIDLALMTHGQSLNSLAGKLFLALDDTIATTQPSCIVVQGDTATVLAGAMSGFYARIPVGHVEAGLRSGNLQAPFPEEFNRRVATLATTWHFAPTKGSAQTLLREGVHSEAVFTTGNTVVDALLHMREAVRQSPPKLPDAIERVVVSKAPFVLITSHRRENFGQGMDGICTALATLAKAHSDCFFIFPVHLNPCVREVVHQRLKGLPNILLTDPCAYRPFIRLLDTCLFVMSDSGGIQEEAPSFGKQVLVMRDTTERPEGVDAGFCHLVGTRPEVLVAAAEKLFASPHTVGNEPNPYGDGRAANAIVSLLERLLTA